MIPTSATDYYSSLLRHRGIRTIDNTVESSSIGVHFNASSDVSDITGRRIAFLSAKEADKSPSQAEAGALHQFLTRATQECGAKHLDECLSARLEKFYTTEMVLTKVPRSRLAKPSGPPDAELALLMHCQSKEGDIGEFWGTQSRSIQLLSKKGLSGEFVFGYDWHRRKEGSARERKGNCPAVKWPLAQRLLHVHRSP